MPSGLPPSLGAVAGTIQEHAKFIIEYLEIPAYNDASHHFQIALIDSVQALKSTYSFLQLACRPMAILLALFSRYLLMALRILSEHTIYHGIVASKELLRQSKIALFWFITSQKKLSRTAVLMELSFIGVCIGMYIIRRYLQRKKVFQKVARWYRSKKRSVLLKYTKIVDSVAQTSIILALLLPHILYTIMTLALKYFTPSLIRYLATSTILSDIISFYVPVVKTIVVLFKYNQYCTIAEKERIIINNDEVNETNNKTQRKQIKSTPSGLLSSLFKSGGLKKKSRVGDAYKKEVNKNNNTLSKKQTPSSLTTKTINSKSSSTLYSDELNQASQDAAEWLKYWIVYAFLTALIQTFTLAPIFGRIFYNADPVNAKKAAASVSRWSHGKRSFSILENIKIPSRVLEECKLFFFLWLRYLPTSLTSSSDRKQGNSNNYKDGNSSSSSSLTSGVHNRIKAFEKQSSNSKTGQRSSIIRRKHQSTKDIAPHSNQPLDIIYATLLPILVSLVSTSSSLMNVNNVNDPVGNTSQSTTFHSFKVKCITFSKTFLNALVWTKIISGSTKDFIENTFHQCSSLLPAAITLMMPSYFTNYGVIYARLLVPMANSCEAYDGIHSLSKNLIEDDQNNIIIGSDGFVTNNWITSSFAVIHQLQYWILQAMISSVLVSFRTVLAWIPFSTHMIWLLWAYVQIKTNTMRLYKVFEWELVAFGILKKDGVLFPVSNRDNGENDNNGSDTNVHDTMTMQFLNTIIQKVPTHSSVNNVVDQTMDANRIQSKDLDKNETSKSLSPEVNEKIDTCNNVDNELKQFSAADAGSDDSKQGDSKENYSGTIEKDDDYVCISDKDKNV